MWCAECGSYLKQYPLGNYKRCCDGKGYITICAPRPEDLVACRQLGGVVPEVHTFEVRVESQMYGLTPETNEPPQKHWFYKQPSWGDRKLTGFIYVQG